MRSVAIKYNCVDQPLHLDHVGTWIFGRNGVNHHLSKLEVNELFRLRNFCQIPRQNSIASNAFSLVDPSAGRFPVSFTLFPLTLFSPPLLTGRTTTPRRKDEALSRMERRNQKSFASFLAARRPLTLSGGSLEVCSSGISLLS